MNCKKGILHLLNQYKPLNDSFKESISLKYLDESSKEINYEAMIEKSGIEVSITIAVNKYIDTDFIFQRMLDVMRFEMLFTGCFYTIDSLQLFDVKEPLVDVEKKEKAIVDTMLECYYSMDATNKCNYYFLEMKSGVYKEYYQKWIDLERKIAMPFRLYLYAISRIKYVNDIRVAYIVAFLEALSKQPEIIAKNNNPIIEQFLKDALTSLNNCNLIKDAENIASRKNLARRMQQTLCSFMNNDYISEKINILISSYHDGIFKKEFTSCEPVFLDMFNSTRNFIFHGATRSRGLRFNGKENTLYALKLQLFVRHLILQEIGYDVSQYRIALDNHINALNEWNGVLDHMLDRLNNK